MEPSFMRLAYGTCQVSYVFAWANVFTRFLWVLTTVCFVFHLCGARAQLGGFQGVLPRPQSRCPEEAANRWVSVQVVHHAVPDPLLGSLPQCAHRFPPVRAAKWRRLAVEHESEPGELPGCPADVQCFKLGVPCRLQTTHSRANSFSLQPHCQQVARHFTWH